MNAAADPPPPEAPAPTGAPAPTEAPAPPARGWLSALIVAVVATLVLAGGLVLYFRSEAQDALPFDYNGFDSKK